MIQRIQSLFFLAASLLFGAEFATSFASSESAVNGIFSDQKYNIHDHVMFQILVGLGVLVSLVALFMYKNRARQIQLGYLVITLSVIFPIVVILFYLNATKDIGAVVINDQIGLYLPLGIMVAGFLAVRFVRKDEKLVQSMDRLR